MLILENNLILMLEYQEISLSLRGTSYMSHKFIKERTGTLRPVEPCRHQIANIQQPHRNHQPWMPIRWIDH